MPNVIGPLFILAAMDVPVRVTAEAGLSFLGLGVLPPTASWGTTLSFTFLGEALRDVFDPRLRKGQ